MIPFKQIEERVLELPRQLDTLQDLVLYYEKKANDLTAFYLDPEFDKSMYRKLSHRLDSNFKISLEELFEVSSDTEDEKKLADYIYSLAWDWGHSCGYSGVTSYYEDLVQVYVLTLRSI